MQGNVSLRGVSCRVPPPDAADVRSPSNDFLGLLQAGWSVQRAGRKPYVSGPVREAGLSLSPHSLKTRWASADF